MNIFFRDGALKRLFFLLEYRTLKASAYIFNEKHENIRKLQNFLIKMFLFETYSGKDFSENDVASSAKFLSSKHIPLCSNRVLKFFPFDVAAVFLNSSYLKIELNLGDPLGRARFVEEA